MAMEMLGENRARTQTDYSVYLEKINAKYEELKNLCS